MKMVGLVFRASACFKCALVGVIDVGEWVTGVSKLVPSADQEQIKADLKAYDADDNGACPVVSYRAAYLVAYRGIGL